MSILNSTAEVHNSRVAPPDNTGHQQNIQEGSGSDGGGLASTALSIGYDIFKTANQNKENRKMYNRQVADNRYNSDVAFQRQQALMASSEAYNSYQNKVSMLRQAGLNPALAFGDLGSSVAAGSADQAAPATPFPANAPNSNLVANLPAALSTFEDIKQKQITNKYLDFKSSQEIFKMIAETNKMIADTSLTDEERNNLITFRSQQLELLKSQTASNDAAAKQSVAQAEYTSGTLTDVGKSIIKLNESSANLYDEKAKSEPVNRANTAANTSLTKTKEQTEKDYNRPEILSRTELNNSAKTLNQEEIEKLDRDNSLSRRQKRMIDEWCKDHGYDDGISKFIYQAFDAAPKSSVESLSSWLDAGNWLPFVSNMVRNFTWRNVMKSDDIPPSDSSSSPVPPSSDNGAAVKPNPSVSNFEKQVDKMMSKATDEQKFIMDHFFRNVYPKLSEIDQYKFRSDFYDKENPRDCIDVIKKYKDLVNK